MSNSRSRMGWRMAELRAEWLADEELRKRGIAVPEDDQEAIAEAHERFADAEYDRIEAHQERIY